MRGFVGGPAGLIIVVLIAGANEVAASEPYPFELAFTRRTINQMERAAVRPDGRHVAFGVRTPVKRPENWFTNMSGAPAYLTGVRLQMVEAATGREITLGPEGSVTFAPSWSPNGELLAYFSDEGGELGSWVFDPATGRSRRLAPVRLKVHHFATIPMPPTWSPDGATLLVPALSSDEQGTDPVIIASGTRRAASTTAPRVLTLSSGAEPAPIAATTATLSPPASTAQTAVDLVAIDVATGQHHILLPTHPTVGLGPVAASYSPSGRFLAVTSAWRRADAPGEPKDSLAVAVVPVGSATPTFREVIAVPYDGHEDGDGDNIGRTCVLMGWHPTRDVLLFCNDYRLRRVDCAGPGVPEAATLAPELGRLNGDYLAVDASGANAIIGLFPDDANRRDDHRAAGLAVVPLAGGPSRRYDIAGSANRGQIIRRAGLSLWEPVPRTVTISATNVGGVGTLFRRLDLAAGQWTDIRVDPATVRVHGMARDGSALVAEVESYAHAPRFHQLQPDLSVGPRLGAVDDRLDRFDMGTAVVFETVVPRYDGSLRPARSAILLPPGARAGDHLPTIVEVYAGSGSAGGARHYGGDVVATVPTPVFTSRGYAVLLVDGNIGPEGTPGEPIEELRDVVLPQVYHSAELGYTDIRRVAVAGQSFGGYSTAALVSSTNLFRAGIAVSGIYDLATNYAGIGAKDESFGVWWSEQGQGRMGQPPWSDYRRYLDNSPFARADRIRTPLLIIHGQDDVNSRVEGAEQLFGALRRLGRTAQLAVYQGEGHVVYEWDLANAIDATRRMLDFLNRHLKPL